METIMNLQVFLWLWVTHHLYWRAHCSHCGNASSPCLRDHRGGAFWSFQKWQSRSLGGRQQGAWGQIEITKSFSEFWKIKNKRNGKSWKQTASNNHFQSCHMPISASEVAQPPRKALWSILGFSLTHFTIWPTAISWSQKNSQFYGF